MPDKPAPLDKDQIPSKAVPDPNPLRDDQIPDIPVTRAAYAALPADTTHEQQTITAGQRQINRIWEITQSVIAISVTGTTLYVAGRLALDGSGLEGAFLLLSNAFFLVVGFYFGRTNHTRTGGVGSNPNAVEGR